MAAILSRSVTGPSKVRRIISLIDEMQILQPGSYSCPALQAGQPVVIFDFRAAADQLVLAQARLIDYAFGSGPCNPVSFSIRGHRQKPLIGGNFLSRVQRLLGIRIRTHREATITLEPSAPDPGATPCCDHRENPVNV